MIHNVVPVPFRINEGYHFRPRVNEIWVNGNMTSRDLSDLIIKLFEAHDTILVACMGPTIVGNGVKGIAIARDYIHEMRQLDVLCRPYFSVIEDKNHDERTRLVLQLELCTIQS